MGQSGTKQAGAIPPGSSAPSPHPDREQEDAMGSRSPEPQDFERVSLPPQVHPLDADDSSFMGPDLQEQMQAEKMLFPDASTWAPDEERLFETLFFRAHRSLLPSHWALDFRGVPMGDTVFDNVEDTAVIRAHGNEFNATTALMRLIDLTADVRTSKQSSLRSKVRRKVKRGLDAYIDWAAQDGGFKGLKIVPNLTVEVLDLDLKAHEITDHMTFRMRALARIHREFWRVDRANDFWEVFLPRPAGTKSKARNTNSDLASLRSDMSDMTPVKPRKRTAQDAEFLDKERLANHAVEWSSPEDSFQSNPEQNMYQSKRRRLAASPTATKVEQATIRDNEETPAVVDDVQQSAASEAPDTPTAPPSLKALEREFVRTKLVPKSRLQKSMAWIMSHQSSEAVSTQSNQETSKTPTTPLNREENIASREMENTKPASATIEYRRPPPVVYGFFILNSLVFCLSADPAKGEDCPVTFHVQTDFEDRHQSVWNALTVAIIVCLARDDMMTRLDEFEKLPTEVESDPDA
ncbi:hypothetical protein S7711_00437 [Stachybotrys chartarum IBT 7711]|uniref:Uncharacterized protein n=1 Tax=Stachybotrys chartarum (strain CBS 109288 / IBT 7711) TaxID=1280523 RepID=A0A084B9Q0_STACB|nr:hypothetical protein S7711_00437 [Stachybotrys chartarum IBT 7711]